MEEYCGAQARFYDLYFTGVEGDVAFYVEEARRAGSPVLELGCGTGRIALPVARAGIRVVGLDRSAPLLALAGQKVAAALPEVRASVELVQGDMREFSLAERFPLVLVPYRAFQHLLTPVDQEQALGCIYEHLEEGGRLVLDLFDPLQDMAVSGWGRGGLKKDTDFIEPQTGNQVVVWYTRHYDPQLQLMEQDLVFEEVDQEGRVVSQNHGRLTLRYTFRYEMHYLLELSGFEVEALYGDFNGGPFLGHGEQVWVARRV